jgi:predicted Rossmann fold nucleotide-binding protein DprA/Smf involved in DNA uptake
MLSADTQAMLLLYSKLGQRDGNGTKPLTLKRFNTLLKWLDGRGLRPGDLLAAEGREQIGSLDSTDPAPDHVAALLDRGAALALTVEKWERSGLWLVGRTDPAYPSRLKNYLGSAAPPLLYGVGPMELLGRGGLAVVGSRDRSEEDAAFARRVGERSAAAGIVVISGAAKGVDRDAMTGALESGGYALGVLAEGLGKAATSAQFRQDLLSGHLTLLSPYEPETGWFAYTAMERNKVLYGLSDAALVVASADETGGTWAGAKEALAAGKVRVFVKASGETAPGNAKLLRAGGVPFPDGDLAEVLTGAPRAEGPEQGALFPL